MSSEPLAIASEGLDACEVGGSEWPHETATVMRFREGKVVSMQDYRTEAEALAAL